MPACLPSSFEFICLRSFFPAHIAYGMHLGCNFLHVGGQILKNGAAGTSLWIVGRDISSDPPGGEGGGQLLAIMGHRVGAGRKRMGLK